MYRLIHNQNTTLSVPWRQFNSTCLPEHNSSPTQVILNLADKNKHVFFVRAELCVDSCVWPHLSQHVTVEDLEHFIKAELAKSLHGVANEGGSPALCQASDTIFPHCHWKAIADALVFIWVHLWRRNNTEEACQQIIGSSGIWCFRQTFIGL